MLSIESFLPSLCLLGQGLSRLQSMSQGFEQSRSGGSGASGFVVLLVLLGVAGVAVAVASYVNKRAQQTRRSPRGLLHELVSAHGLDRAQRKLLENLAGRLALDNPSLVVAIPEMFERAVEADEPDDAATLKYDELRERLFER